VEPISIALGLAQFAPMIAGWLGGSKAKDVASKVVGLAEAVTGKSGEGALAAIQADPNLAVQFQLKVLENQITLAQIAADTEKAELDAEVKVTDAVNQSIQAEAKSDHWPTYSWRPFIGFCFGVDMVVSSILIVLVYAAQVFQLPGADKAIAQLPTTLGALAAIMGLSTPILGIASWFRGRMQADPRVPSDNRG
jgi:hypothetical protein